MTFVSIEVWSAGEELRLEGVGDGWGMGWPGAGIESFPDQ